MYGHSVLRHFAIISADENVIIRTDDEACPWPTQISNQLYCHLFPRKVPMTQLTSQWRHNGRDGVSNFQPRHCLLNCLFRWRSNKTSKLGITGLCVGNSTVTGQFPGQMASNGKFFHLMASSWGSSARFVCRYLYSVNSINLDEYHYGIKLRSMTEIIIPRNGSFDHLRILRV